MKNFACIFRRRHPWHSTNSSLRSLIKKIDFRQPSISLGIKKGKTMLFPWITLRLRDVWEKERRPLIHPFFAQASPWFSVEKGHGNTVPLENKRKTFSAWCISCLSPWKSRCLCLDCNTTVSLLSILPFTSHNFAARKKKRASGGGQTRTLTIHLRESGSRRQKKNHPDCSAPLSLSLSRARSDLLAFEKTVL